MPAHLYIYHHKPFLLSEPVVLFVVILFLVLFWLIIFLKIFLLGILVFIIILPFIIFFFFIILPCSIFVFFIIGERAKRARHSQVCSIENHDIYIIVRTYVTFAL